MKILMHAAFHSTFLEFNWWNMEGKMCLNGISTYNKLIFNVCKIYYYILVNIDQCNVV